MKKFDGTPLKASDIFVIVLLLVGLLSLLYGTYLMLGDGDTNPWFATGLVIIGIGNCWVVYRSIRRHRAKQAGAGDATP